MGDQLTANEVQQIIGQKLGEGMGSAARDTYAAQKMQDLPVTYQSLLPATSDRAQLYQAEQKIRAQYQADMRQVIPRHLAAGQFVGGDSSPEAIAFKQKMSAAQTAMQNGDLVTAHRLLAELNAASGNQGQPAAAPAPPDVSKMTANQKIEYGLEQEAATRRGGGR